MQAVILAGERGAPLYPLTARTPRAMLPIVAKPLVQYSLELLKRHSISDAILCLQVLPEVFESRFEEGKELGLTLRYHREQVPLGTAGAVRAVSDRLVGKNILVLNGHVLTDANLSALIAFHEEKEAAVTILLATVSDASRYGAVVRDAEGRVLAFAEKPPVGEVATDTINAGIYVIRRDILRRIPAGTEFSFERQLFPQLVAEGAPVYGCVAQDRYWRSITTLTDYQRAQSDVLEQRVEARIEGVEVREGVWVGEGATIHPTAEIRGRVFLNHHTDVGRGAQIRGTVVIGSRCQIGEGALIEDSVIWRGCVLEEQTEVRGSILGNHCTVRAGARIRPGAVVGADAVIASVVAHLPSQSEVQRAGIRFGTDGWRGILGDDVTFENVRLVTQALCDWVKSDAVPGEGVIIGYDTRSQSDLLARAAAEVVAANGLRARLSRSACPSPTVSFACRFFGAAAGLVVTASHNPASFSGLKVKANYGGPASPEMTTRIEEKLRELLMSGGTARTEGGAVEVTDLAAPYLAHCARFVPLERLSAAGLVVVDALHGAAAGYLTQLLAPAGVAIQEIRTERNPFFGGVIPDPTPENLEALFTAVPAAQATLGLALDGDGDRLGACDASGAYVDAHKLFALLLRHLIRTRDGKGSVVRTVSTTRMIDKLCAAHNLSLIETPIGFKFLCQKMLTEDILLAGEESGGFGIAGHLPERDAVLSALLVLEAVALSGKSLPELLSELTEEVGPHEYLRINLRPTPAQMHRIHTALQGFRETHLAGAEIAAIRRRDGTRLDFTDGSWLLLRPSGTEPLVRVYAEAATRTRARELTEAGASFIVSS
ncbi:sugar phosphate nucleotidyltransferase [Armatimonas sp.]|uniref:sugar phosphate nucleotidyltransferase n=1 Tax=Armatimonas sp. TaxID=1872638 RepID=UPI00286AD5E2|nr:sugar phosphate nucleotidyltransferase [Armatimonas sp.]